jgi:hypothetical protein
MLGIAVAAVLAGVTVAILTSSAHKHAHASSTAAVRVAMPGDLAAAGRYLGLSAKHLRRELRVGKTLAGLARASSGRSPAGLVNVLVSAKTARLDAAVATGRLTRARANAQLAKLQQRAGAEIHRAHLLGRPGTGIVAVSARYLGVSERQILVERRARRSLAQVAAARKGKSAAGLVNALVAARKANLAAALSASSLRRSERALAELRKRMTAAVARVPARHA